VIYAVGGDVGHTSFNTVEAYDPVANTWTTKAPISSARTDIGVGVVNGVLYAIGGVDSAVSDAVEAYEPVTNTWTTKASMPTPRAGLRVGVVNGVLYAIGGDSAPSSHSHTVEAYDPATDSWTTKAPMPSTRSYFGVGVVNGIIYVVGGAPSPNSLPELGTNEAYDPVTDTWTTKASMPTARHLMGIGVVNGVLFAVGGDIQCCTFIATNESYDPVADAWTTQTSMPTQRAGPGVAAVNGVLYAIGGVSALGAYSSTNEAFLSPITALPIFLRGTGGPANPSILSLSAVAPTAATAKYKDSPSVKFAGGNPWTTVGTWVSAPGLVNGTITALDDAHVWLGLKNSDDIGTRFDLRVEAYRNGALVASGQALCILGITQNPSNAKLVAVSFGPFSPVTFNGTSDTLSLKVLTRIGTTPGGASCGGHTNAVGLRTYFDATNRDAGFSASF
jgi:N-acetylneuraminic acid mutarotase